MYPAKHYLYNFANRDVKICYGKYIYAQSQKYFPVDVPMVLIRLEQI